MTVPFTFGLVSSEKRVQQYKIFFMKNPMDIGRHIKKKAFGIDNLRKSIIANVLNKSYNKTAWVATEDGRWVGHLRWNAKAKRYEWTSEKDWTDLHAVAKDGTIKAVKTARRK